MAYSKFVLVSHLRSGTHFLRTLLESHPAIVCQSEVFNSDDPDLPYPLSIPSQEILDRWVYRPFEPTVQCAGFVLQAYHPLGLKAFPGIRENPGWQNVWDVLQATPDLKIIHLSRENLLRRHLSHVMARQSGAWHQWEKQRIHAVTHLHPPAETGSCAIGRPRVRLDAGRLRVDFEEVESLHERVRQRFQGLAYFALSYESLCAATGRVGVQLLEFLGVEKLPLNPAVWKLERRLLAECIENYRELEKEFAATRWAHFFDEEANVFNDLEHPG